MARGDDDGHGLTRHDTAERGRRLVRLAIVHPAAHIGIEREILHPQQNLPVARSWQYGFLKAEVGELGLPLGPGDEDDLAGFACEHINYLLSGIFGSLPIFVAVPRRSRDERTLQRSGASDILLAVRAP